METLGLKVEVNPEGADSAGRFWLSYNPFLKQFSADSVVSHFNLRIGSGKGFHLLVICSDLYSPAMNWTSGASIGKSMVISETRLNPDFWDEAENSSSPAEMSWEVAEASSTAEITVSEPVLFIRLLKVALHETGHCMGIDLHCSNEGCVMRDAGSIEEIDELGVDFCNICLHEMKKKPIR
ncbi:MAG: hypothetical protein CVV64_16635 [Candidatus Wallbacteria bacterium HGW-Wallbacteria-1]|uniref:Archaemetzincin n=1 Tax=Candidatus Wallbacteria bacterium HGW-Wallbacteria-1 TaxID=2013854 RepID=A0A2N1PKZ4_9BACT|nr:MAG: hypothetical protein CVV64_16635 [Candidatus Wallbacteria bacterium HGW-Wallbacteria-1]